MNLKKTLATIGGAIALTAGSLALTAGPSFGADNGTITAGVGVRPSERPCLTVLTPSVSFGTNIALTPPGTTGIAAFARNLGIQNCGAAASRIFARASNLTDDPLRPTATWTLKPGPSVCTVNEATVGLIVGGNASIVLSTSDITAFNSLGAGASPTLDALVVLPCDGSAGDGKLMSTTLTFTAVLP
jgi:hypothetical protein